MRGLSLLSVDVANNGCTLSSSDLESVLLPSRLRVDCRHTSRRDRLSTYHHPYRIPCFQAVLRQARTRLRRPVLRPSEKSFSSPDAKIPRPHLSLVTQTVCSRVGSKDSPLRSDRPASSWGRACFFKVYATSATVPLKRHLSTKLVKAFAIRRSQHRMFFQSSPPTERSFTLPTVCLLTAPKKAFYRNRVRGVDVCPNRLPYKDRDNYHRA